jgi:hypothetical protein
MLSLIKVIVLTISIFLLLSVSPLTIAQTAPTTPGAPAAPTPVDQSNAIFPGCRISVLSGGSNKGKVTQETKKKFLTGCVEEIIRFIIIMVCLVAVLRIASGGLAQIFPEAGGELSVKPATTKKLVTDLIIGLFLLVVGWNLVGILNASFNNVDFLNLPAINPCNIPGGCETPAQKKKRQANEAISKYALLKKDNTFTGSEADRGTLIDTLKEICAAKSTDEVYKTLNTSFCSDKYEDVIAKAGKTATPSTPPPTTPAPTPTDPNTPAPNNPSNPTTPSTPSPSTPSSPTPDKAAIKSKNTKKILFIGDSLSVDLSNFTYSSIVKNSPNCKECKIIAVSGKNTSWMSSVLAQELTRIAATKEAKYDLVMVFGGTNYVSSNQSDLSSMYKRINSYGAGVIGTTLPGSKFFGSQDRIQNDIKLNEWIRNNSDLMFVAEFASDNRADYEQDGIHFTATKQKERAAYLQKLIND